MVPVPVAHLPYSMFCSGRISFVQDLRERHRIENGVDEECRKKQAFLEMVWTSAALKRILRQVEMVAPTDANVLILGKPEPARNLWRERSID